MSTRSQNPLPTTPRKVQNKPHIKTPHRSIIRSLNRQGLKHHEIRRILVETYNINPSQSTISRISSQRECRRTQGPEKRGRKRKWSDQDLEAVKQTLDQHPDVKFLNWNEIASASSLGDLMGPYEYMTLRNRYCEKYKSKKYIAIQKDELPQKIADRRVAFAKKMLQERPNPEDWEDVIFTDESHFSWGPEGKLRVLREQGTRYNPEHIYHRCRKPQKEDIKRFHVWAGVGYNFISPLIFYNSNNSNRKMTQDCYIQQILEPYVKEWLHQGYRFTLEEDNDSGHGTLTTKNPIFAWKKANNLKWYGNAPYSLDLAIIETCWSAPKQETRRIPHYDDETLRGLILEGWDRHQYAGINKMIHSMPQRLKDVITLKGQYTAY